MPGRGRAAGASCCGSRISTPAAAGPSLSTGIIEDLRWLGLDWDGEPLVQSRADRSFMPRRSSGCKAQGLVYPCFCTRADIAASLTAPHGDAGAAYPGTCRGLPDDPERRAATPHSWRLDSAAALGRAGLPGWTEDDGRSFTATPSRHRRRDPRPQGRAGQPIISPASSTMPHSGVTLVVRGADLRAVDPDPAPAPDAARPARADLSPPSAGHP